MTLIVKNCFKQSLLQTILSLCSFINLLQGLVLERSLHSPARSEEAGLCPHVEYISACPPSDRQPSYRRLQERRSALSLGQAHVDITVCHAADTFLLCHCRHLSLPPPLPPNQKFKKLEPNGLLADARKSKCKQCTLRSVRVDNVFSSYQWWGRGKHSHGAAG